MASLLPRVDLCMVPTVPPPDDSPPNFDNPESLSTATIAIASVMIFLTTLFVGTRIWINWQNLKWSDYFTVIAYLLQTGFSGIIVSLHQYGRHLWDIPMCWMTTSYLKRIYAHSLLFGLALLFSKAAIFLLYLEIFGTNRRTRLLIWVGLVLTVLLYSTFIPFTSVYNAPAAGQSWDGLFARIADLKRAQVILRWSLAIGAGSILLDFYIFILPIPILTKLHVSKIKRLQLTALFGTALLGVVASIVALAYRVYLITDPLDSTWHTAAVDIANMIENDVAIIVGSMPAFSHFLRERVAGGSLWKSVSSAWKSSQTGGSTNRASILGRSWPPSSKGPYGLRSRPHSEEGFELTSSQQGIIEGSTANAYAGDSLSSGQRVGQEVGGIVRTVDIFQQVQHQPEPTHNLV
ncbi:hypothetical protein GGR51DRAFT_128195 [Nemania sp. FL0031]|nr:hypothetical protein GGR51DRAFT_128195 [Nemania sp. FL0031]